MTTFGQPHRHVAVCDSTNDLARAWAADTLDPAPHGALVTADFQTLGRGRRGRHWDAPAAQSALMSFILRSNTPLADAWHLGFLAALATADALVGMDLDARLKWPNDVLLEGSKVAGVLVETLLTPGQFNAAIIGIGLNVNQVAFEASDYPYPPTSLRLVRGHDSVLEDVIAAVAEASGRWDATYRADGFVPLFDAWQARLAVGAAVRCGSETATLISVQADGGATVRRPDGTFAVWAAVEE